ncbi:MAG: sulfite exporter TauE/SafE family protein [Candidatus Electryonea clarkiae]|nr:sulfite exporter TauE/SafE family protein [Candidatus Electryonea clarkiae]MDP8285832.1 sulfite exporter TauE/SafE family protein [Candidatus Electryonea clarkiae]
MSSAIFDYVLLFSGGLLAGSLGGLLGIGGGIVLMPLLRYGFGLSPVFAAGTCVVAVFFTTLGGSYRHHRLGHLEFRPIVPIIISGVLTASIFSLLFGYVSKHDHWLDMGIGIVFSLISVRMIVEGIRSLDRKNKTQSTGNKIDGTLAQKISIGGLAGVLPGLLGIGTGGILVPAFTFLLKAPVKTAVAASLACFCCNAFVSSVFKYVQGFVELSLVIPVCLGTVIGANLGAMLNKRFPSGGIKLLFGLVFTYVSLKFIMSSFAVKI